MRDDLIQAVLAHTVFTPVEHMFSRGIKIKLKWCLIILAIVKVVELS